MNDLNDLRIIGSAEFYTGLFAAGREHAARKSKCNHCLNVSLLATYFTSSLSRERLLRRLFKSSIELVC